MPVPVSMPLLARACRVFMRLAYPDGPETIPSRKRIYADLPESEPVEDYLPPSPAAEEVGQVIFGPNHGVRGYSLRLGSVRFPHLKLKVQLVDFNNSTTWVFMVDTHDAFSKSNFYPPPDHPDAAAWRDLQAANRELKSSIETALEQEGLVTFHGLLRAESSKPA